MEGIDKKVEENLMRVFKDFEKHEKEIKGMRAKLNFGWISKEEYEEWSERFDEENRERVNKIFGG